MDSWIQRLGVGEAKGLGKGRVGSECRDWGLVKEEGR